MNPSYKILHETAHRLHEKFLDMRDDRDHQINQLLEHETREVREDLERGKSPRTIEDRIKNLQRQLDQARRNETGALSSNHADELHDQYDDLRQKLRSLPNY